MSSQRRLQGPPSKRREQDYYDEEHDGDGYTRSQRQQELDSDEEMSTIGGQYPSPYRAGEASQKSRRKYPKSADNGTNKAPSGGLILVLVIVVSLVGTYFLSQQVRAKALSLAVAKDMNTALATELEESRAGATALSKQLKTLEDALYQAREKCAKDIKKLDSTLDQLRKNTTVTANQLKNEKLITAKLIQENELYQKKLQAANSVAKGTAKTVLRGKAF